MSKRYRAWNIDQPQLLPSSVQEFVPEGHVAHFVRDLVRDNLDLSGILDGYQEARGYPPYHPVMMTALLLYSYCQGIHSSRAIARACEQRVDFMAVTAMQCPDFRTIWLFRERHRDALSGLFVQVLGLCAEAGLVKLGHVALDGTKMHANASRHKAMSYGRMKQREQEYAAQVAAWFEQTAATDEAEDEAHGAERRGDELPEWVKNRQARLEKIREAMAALEAEAAREHAAKMEAATPPADGDASGGDAAAGAGGGMQEPDAPPAPPAPPAPSDKAQRNFTDPESRIMKTQNGFEQAYNGQAIVDADSQVIVAHGLTNAANDKQQLVPMVEQLIHNTGRLPQEFSADSGYCSEANLEYLERLGIRGYVATGRQKHGSASATGSRETGTCTAAMSRRLKQGGHRSRYRLRKQTVEPVFGQIKAARGLRQFLTRGLEKVRAEWGLECTAHNLLKLAAVW